MLNLNKSRQILAERENRRRRSRWSWTRSTTDSTTWLKSLSWARRNESNFCSRSMSWSGTRSFWSRSEIAQRGNSRNRSQIIPFSLMCSSFGFPISGRRFPINFCQQLTFPRSYLQGWGRLQRPDYDYDYSAHKIIDYDYSGDWKGDYDYNHPITITVTCLPWKRF